MPASQCLFVRLPDGPNWYSCQWYQTQTWSKFLVKSHLYFEMTLDDDFKWPVLTFSPLQVAHPSFLNDFDLNNVGPASQIVAQHHISIEPMYRVIWCFWRRNAKRHHPAYSLACRSHKTRYNHPRLFQCRASVEDCRSTLKQHWMNATCLRKVYSRPSDGLVLGQRRIWLTSIDQTMGCDAGPTLNQNLAGRPTSSVRGTW